MLLLEQERHLAVLMTLFVTCLVFPAAHHTLWVTLAVLSQVLGSTAPADLVFWRGAQVSPVPESFMCLAYLVLLFMQITPIF